MRSYAIQRDAFNPAILSQGRLDPALRGRFARRSAIRVDLHIGAVRYRPAVAVTAYYVVARHHHTIKHAEGGACGVHRRGSETGILWVRVPRRRAAGQHAPGFVLIGGLARTGRAIDGTVAPYAPSRGQARLIEFRFPLSDCFGTRLLARNGASLKARPPTGDASSVEVRDELQL